MKNKLIKKHQFFTYSELINKLKSKGLKIVNEPKLINYFVKFNYQNVINGYKKPFLTEYIYKEYLPTANSQMIIDFFNFNRTISKMIINDLHAIEMQLSSCIAYKLMEIINKLHPGKTSIDVLSSDQKSKLFKSNSSKKIINENLQKNFDELKENKEYIDSHWSSWEEVPLYSLSLMWTFGVSIKLFTCLNDEIKQDILAKFVAIKNININTFISLLYCFKDLRNKISHNEPIYKFKFDLYKLVYKTWLLDSKKSWSNLKGIIIDDLNHLLLFDHNLKSNFKLYSVIKIIANITNNLKLVTLFK